jgi:hypothetical protein
VSNSEFNRCVRLMHSNPYDDSLQFPGPFPKLTHLYAPAVHLPC